MRSRAFAVFAAILVFLHLLLHAGFGLGGVAPDFIAIAVLLAARRTTATKVTILAIALGFLDDALGIRNLGARSLALGTGAILGTWSRRIVEGEGPLFMMAYLFVGKWVIDVVLAAILPAGSTEDVLLGLATWAPLNALYAAVAGTLALAAFRMVMGPDA